MNFMDIETPCLLLDLNILKKNCEQMRNKCLSLNTTLRPHVKTPKNIEIAKIALNKDVGPITVSTLQEAEYFSSYGFKDILYAVGIVPAKLPRIAKIQLEKKSSIKIVLDSIEIARSISDFSSKNKVKFETLIEIDSGEGRGGLNTKDEAIMKEITSIFKNNKFTKLVGVMTHAGHSYATNDKKSIIEIANHERDEALKAKKFLKKIDQECSIVSIGSTPTIMYSTNLEGITEVRCGIYMMWDLAQASRGICKLNDIAVTVLASVIHHKVQEKKIIIDAGALSISKDLTANKFMPDAKYGLICDLKTGKPILNLNLTDLHQEHGTIDVPNKKSFKSLPIGSLIRILPNHSCLTCAGHEKYYVLHNNEICDVWHRINGW